MENKYTDYQFSKETKNVLKALNFKQPTPIQKETIPAIQKGFDVVGISKTGSGKTHSFLIPIFENIDRNLDQVQAIIIAPTRELATQIFENVKVMVEYHASIKARLFIGGSDRQKAIDSLNIVPQIIVATPGRLKDIIEENTIRTDFIKYFVVDEADMALDFGFLEDIDYVAGKMSETLQMMVFSATIPEGLKPFLRKYMNNPKIIEIKNDKASTIKHTLIPCRHKDKNDVLLNLLKGFDPYICLIFTNTRKNASELAKTLSTNGIKVAQIHGDLQPRERKQIMKRIQNLEYKYIVATDIAARGIDIDGVSHVVNYEFPKENEFYIHRSGRTGRAKYEGTCFSLYNIEDEKVVSELEKMGVEFTFEEFKNDVWTDLGVRTRSQKVKKHNKLDDSITKKVSTKKKMKVKPGYKKKIKEEVAAIKRKEKRKMISGDIKTQKKNRAVARQIRKNQREAENNNR